MGIVKRLENIVTVVPPSHPVSTGYLWLAAFCFFNCNFLRLSPMVAVLWSHLTRENLGVCMFLLSYPNIKVYVVNLQILSIAASLGVLGIQRYIKEGETVSVMGIVKRHENIVTAVPPSDPVSTGCQWLRCLLPTYILTCNTHPRKSGGCVVCFGNLTSQVNITRALVARGLVKCYPSVSP